MNMEAVEIKTEPLDEYFNQIFKEEVIIKSENETGYTSFDDIYSKEPEVQITENWLEPKEELTKKPKEFLIPDRFLNEDRLQKEIVSDLVSNHCKFCNMFFKSRTTLKLHERNCHYKNYCRLCGQKFVTSYALNTHLNKIHNRMMESKSPQKKTTKNTLGRSPNISSGGCDKNCDVCSLKFANSRDLNNHKKKHNTCQQCGENLKSTEDLKKHICDNIVVKEEAIPKKIKFRALYHENASESSSDNENSICNFTPNTSPKSGFSVVTRDTDFEAFAQQMMKGFTDASEHQIFKKTQDSSDKDSKDRENEQIGFLTKTNRTKKAETPKPDNVIVDYEGNVYKILKENFVGPSALIKDEPIDEAESDENVAKSKMPFPLPFIKDEPTDQHNITDSTDLLLEELFDRKAKSMAKVRQTKFPFNPSFEPNGLGFKVKKDINAQKSVHFQNKTPKSNSSPPKKKKRYNSSKNKSSVRNVVVKTKPLPLTVSHISRRKSLSHKIKDEILENITPDCENNSFNMSKKSKKISLKSISTKSLPAQKLCTKPLKTPTKELIEKSLPNKKLPVRNKCIPSPKKSNTLNRKLPTLKNSTRNQQSKLLISQNTINNIFGISGKEYLNLGYVSEYMSGNKIPGDSNSVAGKNSSTDSARDETSYSAGHNCPKPDVDHISADDSACSGSNVKKACVETLVSLKSEDLEGQINSTVDEKTGETASKYNSSQQPCGDFEIPSNGDFDFEEVIQSNKLPNFNNVSKVIQKLTEEYKKAEKVKLEDNISPIIEVDSQGTRVLPETIKDQSKPSSLFFPMLDDTQVYNMVANALNEKYRYVWICPMCPRQYSQLRPFKKHLLTIHFKNTSELEGQAFELRPELVVDAGPNETFCHLCHVTLADNATLRKHQVEMHKEQDLTMRQKKKPLLHRCYICTKLCVSRTLLAEHMKSDCGKNPQYGCNVCEKKFHTKSTLNLHKTMHTGELPHSCGFCQKRFRTRGQLTVHTRTHTGEKPFPCKVCGQCFTHRETLIAHLSRHIDMKRYKCYGCDQFFSCISGLKTHRSVRPDTCGRVELNARAVGPRVRVIKGNVIFEPQPLYNARLAKVEKPVLESYILDHNYYRKDPYHTKKVSKKNIKSETINSIITPKNSLSECFF